MSTPWFLMFWCHGPPGIGQAATVQGHDPEVGAWAFIVGWPKLKDRIYHDIQKSQLLPISKKRSWSGTGKGGKTKEVCERLCATKLCVTKLCVWQNCVCDKARRRRRQRRTGFRIQDQKQEPQTMMRGKKHETNWQFQLSLLPAALKIRGSYHCTPLQ